MNGEFRSDGRSRVTVAMVGCGNMGAAILAGASEWLPGYDFVAVDPDPDKAPALLPSGTRVRVSPTFDRSVAPDCVILAVKPQAVTTVLDEMRDRIAGKLAISIAAGVGERVLSERLPLGFRLIRVMPNLPAMVGEAMTVGFARELSASDRTICADVFSSVGQFAWGRERGPGRRGDRRLGQRARLRLRLRRVPRQGRRGPWPFAGRSRDPRTPNPRRGRPRPLVGPPLGPRPESRRHEPRRHDPGRTIGPGILGGSAGLPAPDGQGGVRPRPRTIGQGRPLTRKKENDMTMNRRDILALTTATAASAAMGLRPAFAQDADSLERVRQSKKLRIGVTSAEPWFFKDPMSNTWSGVGIDLGNQVAGDLVDRI